MSPRLQTRKHLAANLADHPTGNQDPATNTASQKSVISSHAPAADANPAPATTVNPTYSTPPQSPQNDRSSRLLQARDSPRPGSRSPRPASQRFQAVIEAKIAVVEAQASEHARYMRSAQKKLQQSESLPEKCTPRTSSKEPKMAELDATKATTRMEKWQKLDAKMATALDARAELDAKMAKLDPGRKDVKVGELDSSLKSRIEAKMAEIQTKIEAAQQTTRTTRKVIEEFNSI